MDAGPSRNLRASCNRFVSCCHRPPGEVLFVTEQRARGNLCWRSPCVDIDWQAYNASTMLGGETMLLGMNISSFTLIHALIALLGIASGLVVMYGLLTTNRLDRLITLLLVTTATTNLSRLLFPFKGVSP